MRPYRNVDAGRWQVSLRGGRQPLWSRNGRELFYRDFTGAIMAVSVASGSTFMPGEAVKLLEGKGYMGGGGSGSARTYDVSLDGSRFLMIKNDPDAQASLSLVAVLNWPEQLKRLAPR